MRAIAYRNRVLKAQRMFAAGAVHRNGGEHEYDVDSQSTPGKQYNVELKYVERSQRGYRYDELDGTHCTCPDFKRQEHLLELYEAEGVDPPWEPAFIVEGGVRYPVCKHVLAALREEGMRFHV